jgi:hypothetical protein
MLDCVSILLTLYRCALDGNIRPPLDLEELYGHTFSEMEAAHRNLPNGGTFWNSPDHAGG